MRPQETSSRVGGDQNMYFKFKCFPNPIQIEFVPKSNQSVSITAL